MKCPRNKRIKYKAEFRNTKGHLEYIKSNGVHKFASVDKDGLWFFVSRSSRHNGWGNVVDEARYRNGERFWCVGMGSSNFITAAHEYDIEFKEGKQDLGIFKIL